MGTVLKGLPLSRYFRLRQEQLNADVCSVSETIAIDEVGEMPATLHEEVPTAADVINEKVPTTDAKEENVAKADVIDDNVSGSDAPSDSDEEQNVREHDDASTDGMEVRARAKRVILSSPTERICPQKRGCSSKGLKLAVVSSRRTGGVPNIPEKSARVSLRLEYHYRPGAGLEISNKGSFRMHKMLST